VLNVPFLVVDIRFLLALKNFRVILFLNCQSIINVQQVAADIIESLSTNLFRLLLTNNFSREKWASMRQSCELLASTLHQYAYACEIQDKNKAMKTIHLSGMPW